MLKRLGGCLIILAGEPLDQATPSPYSLRSSRYTALANVSASSSPSGPPPKGGKGKPRVREEARRAVVRRVHGPDHAAAIVAVHVPAVQLRHRGAAVDVASRHRAAVVAPVGGPRRLQPPPVAVGQLEPLDPPHDVPAVVGAGHYPVDLFPRVL